MIDGNIPNASNIKETSNLAGDSMQNLNAMPSAEKTEGGIASEAAEKTPNIISGTENTRADSGGYSDVSSGISMISEGSETSGLQKASSLVGTTNVSHGESSHAGGADDISESVGVMSRNLGNYQDSIAPQTQTSSSSSIIGGESQSAVSSDAAPIRVDPAATAAYNQAQFQQFMPGYEQQTSSINFSRQSDGVLEVRHPDGTGTAFYDNTMYKTPRGEHQVFEDNNGGKWYAVQGTPTVERRPVYENGKAVYENGEMRTENVEGMRYKTTPEKFTEPKKRDVNESKPPRKKQ